ncbi:MAG: nucleoside deaminase [Acholeplasmatales bacterium]|nr:nucleoside deaminase [Acholeplasmatales bacterium]
MNKYMFLAIEEATKGITAGDGGPFGCVIVKGEEIVGRGHNRVVLKHDPTCHGEMEAIRDACAKLGTFDLTGCTLYTTGEPCPMCFGAILWANIDKVYYGCNVKDTDKIGFRDEIFYNMTEEKKNIFQTELDRDECLKLYDKYMSIQDKVNY